MSFITHNATKVWIWTLILALPLQGLVLNGSVCASDGTACNGGRLDCCCCCSLEHRQQHSCCCHKSETTGTCCQKSGVSQSKCECGIGCPCGEGKPSDIPAAPSRDSDARSDIASLALTPNSLDTAPEIKCPQQRVQLQTEAIQSLSIDRCSTLCRYTL